MYIIKAEPYENGSRPPLQTWHGNSAPKGYLLCGDEYQSVFYSTTPAGFVNIKSENGVITEMSVNREAYDAYVSANPAGEAETPIDYDSVLLDHDYRLLCLEMGISE